ATPTRISQVEIYWSDANGDQIASNVNVYTRTGSLTCAYASGSITVPYTLSTERYPETERCDVIAGCGGLHTTVDDVGVRITYVHQWVTQFGRVVAAVERVLTGSGAQIILADVSAIRIYKSTTTGAETSGAVNQWAYLADGGPLIGAERLDFVEQSNFWPACGRVNTSPADSAGI